MPSKVSKTLISFLSTVSNGNVPDVYDCRFSLSFLVFPLSLALSLALSLTRFFPAMLILPARGLTMGLPNRIIHIKVNLRLCWRIYMRMRMCVCVCSYVWRQLVSLIKLYSVTMIFMYFEVNGSKLNETRAGTKCRRRESRRKNGSEKRYTKSYWNCELYKL